MDKPSPLFAGGSSMSEIWSKLSSLLCCLLAASMAGQPAAHAVMRAVPPAMAQGAGVRAAPSGALSPSAGPVDLYLSRQIATLLLEPWDSGLTHLEHVGEIKPGASPKAEAEAVAARVVLGYLTAPVESPNPTAKAAGKRGAFRPDPGASSKPAARRKPGKTDVSPADALGRGNAAQLSAIAKMLRSVPEARERLARIQERLSGEGSSLSSLAHDLDRLYELAVESPEALKVPDEDWPLEINPAASGGDARRRLAFPKDHPLGGLPEIPVPAIENAIKRDRVGKKRPRGFLETLAAAGSEFLDSILASQEPASPPVQPLDEAAEAFLRENGIETVAASEHPEVGPFLSRLAGLAEELLDVEEDGDQPVRVALVDDMTLDVSYAEMEHGERILTVTLGALKFVENDDELAYLIGHALERGHSDLSERIEELRSSRDMLKKIRAQALERVTDSEADVKSVLRRVIGAGYNPHAAYDYLDRALAAKGEEWSRGSLGNSARRDAIAIAIAYWVRELGKDPVDRFGDRERSKSVLGGIKSGYVDADAFEAVRRKRAMKIIRSPGSDAEEGYRKALKKNVDSDDVADFYGEDFRKRWAAVLRLTGGLFGDEESVELQLDLHRSLDRAYNRARKAVLPEGFKPRSITQALALHHLEERSAFLDLPELFDARQQLRWQEGELRKTREELAKVEDPEELSEYEDAVKSEEKELEEVKAQYARAKLPFVDDRLDEKLDAIITAPGFYDHFYNSKFGAQLLLSYGIRHRKIDGLIHRRRARMRALADDNRKLLLERPRHLMSFHSIMKLYMSHGKRDRELAPLLRAYSRTAVRTFSRESDELLRLKLIDYLDSTHYFLPQQGVRMWELFSRYWRVEPAAAHKIFRGFVTRMLGKLKTASEVASFASALSAYPELGLVRELYADPVVARKIIDRQLELMETELPAAESHKEVFGLIDGLEGSLRGLSAAGPTEILSRDRLDEVLETALPFAARRLRYRTFGKTVRRRVRTVLVFRSPWLFHDGAKLSEAEREQAGKDLASVAGNKRVGKKLKNAVEFPALAGLLYDRSDHGGFMSYALGVAKIVDFALGRDLPAWLRRLQLRMMRWLRQDHSDRGDVAGVLGQYDGGDDRVSASYMRFFTASFRRLLEENAHLGKRAAVEDASYRFWKRWSDAMFRPINNESMTRFIAEWTPEDPQERLEFFVAYTDGITRFLKEKEEKGGGPTYYPMDTEWEIRTDLEGVLEVLKDPSVYEDLDPKLLAEVLERMIFVEKHRSAVFDRLFELVWTKRGEHPAVARVLDDPELVPSLFFQSNKLKAAKRQLERKFDLTRYARENPPGPHASVRDVVDEAFVEIEELFPRAGLARTDLVRHVMDVLTTNQAETALLAELIPSMDDWSDIDGIEGVDAPHAAARYIKSHEDRLRLVRYLTGQDDEPPHLKSAKSYATSERFLESLRSARRFFTDADSRVRMYMLQPLLDENEGLLSDEASTDKLHGMILGSYAGEPLLRKLFSTYLGVLQVGERKVVLGMLLAGLADSRENKASLRSILEALGPFGIKAGQFLYTSGVIPAEDRAQLESFLDNALRPTRAEVIEELEDVFGEDLGSIEYVGRILGSGSLNFIVEVRMRDPNGGEPRRVGIRILRRSAEGTIQSENAVWERVIALLREDKDSAVRRMASLAEEARSHSYLTLAPGGIELDQEVERKAYPFAREAYRARRSLRTGWKTRAVRPILDLQDGFVPAEHAKRVSIIELIDHSPWRELGPGRLRARLAAQVVRSELKAIFRKGVFDPDGHPGNWLVSLVGRFLVRIDYAQLREISADDAKAFRDMMAALIRARPGAKTADRIMAAMLRVFRFENGEPAPDAVRSVVFEAVADADFPPYSEPTERLLFIQDRLERRLRDAGYPDLEISLHKSARGALFALAKIGAYKKWIGEGRYNRILARALGLSPLLLGIGMLLRRGRA